MKSLMSFGITSCAMIPVLCVNLVASPSAFVRASGAPFLAENSESRFLHMLSLESHPEIATELGSTLGDLVTLKSADASALSISAPLTLLASDTDAPTATIVRSSGAIEDDVNLFRALLGGPNNNATPGQQTTGHREINWDGVPAAVTNVPTFPLNFFNVNSPRGLVYDPTTPGLEVTDQSFIDVNPAYNGQFAPFSGHKTFSPIGGNETDLRFFVAGSNRPAAVKGIGIVFVDVDKVGSASITLIDANDAVLGRFTAPVRTDRRGSSFLGITFRDPVIARVHIVAGEAALSATEVDVSNGGQHDLVVMDDFLYGEPIALP
jgi:hypothetical protein